MHTEPRTSIINDKNTLVLIFILLFVLLPSYRLLVYGELFPLIF